MAVYPCRSLMPRALWQRLIAAAKDELTFAGYTNYFFWLEQPGLGNALRRKAEQGANIRFLVGDPDSPVTTDREAIEGVPPTVSTRIRVTLDELNKIHDRAPQIAGRYSDRHIAMSIWRFDNDMIVCTHLADKLGNDSPTIHLRRKQDDGLFDRYTLHVEHLWQHGHPIWA